MSATRSIFVQRAAVALAQAAAIYIIVQCGMGARGWPRMNLHLAAPLLTVAGLAPLILIFGLGQISIRPLAIWAGSAGAVLFGLSYYATTRMGHGQAGFDDFESLRSGFATTAALFVANVLAFDSIKERRFNPSYASHFDTAWKQALQTVLTAVFTGVFWGVLWLGAGLFDLVNLHFFEHLISHLWFADPATALAIAASIHLTDVQPAIIRGTRALALTLFSWLLPLLAFILAGFLLTLPFTGLKPLWDTHFAALLLLVAAGFIVFFINCAVQDGARLSGGARAKHYAAMAGAVELAPLTVLAICAIWLRVAQYGWTVERIFGAAVCVLTACYAGGYGYAVIRSPDRLKPIESTNFVVAYVFIGLVLALFSPVADPARLMVADQVARLESGAIAPEKFDFYALKREGARWGEAALARLAVDRAMPAYVNAQASLVLAMRGSWRMTKDAVIPANPEARMTIYPAGQKLPPGFLAAAMNARGFVPACFRVASEPCVARIVTLTPGGAAAVVFLNFSSLSLFVQSASGQWQEMPAAPGQVCPDLAMRLAQGNFAFLPHGAPDVLIGGRVFSFNPPPVFGRCEQ